MTPVRKVEIVIDTLDLERVVAILTEVGVSGYTVIRDASGSGDRGWRTGDELSGVFRNSYLLTACTPQQAEVIAEKVQPLLREVGGICLVSDALWVEHND